MAIPEYRLPKKVLDWEIEGILILGIEFRTGVNSGQGFWVWKPWWRRFGANFLGNKASGGYT